MRGALPLHWAVGKNQSESVVNALIAAHPDGCKTADNDFNTPLHLAIEYEATDDVITMLISSYAGASRAFNILKQLPYDLAKEHNASGYVLAALEKADKEARDAEVGLLAWLWG